MANKFFLALIILLGMLVSGCSFDNSDTNSNYDTDPAPEIKEGVATLLFSQVGAIQNALGTTIGSGVLITPDVILTCHHVLNNTQLPALMIPPYVFVVNYIEPRVIIKTYQVPRLDLEVCVLSHPVISSTPAIVKRDEIAEDDWIIMVGYGMDLAKLNPIPGIKELGLGQVTKYSTGDTSFTLKGVLNQNALYGDSGGGAFDMNGMLAGIMYEGQAVPTKSHNISNSSIQEAINDVLSIAYLDGVIPNAETLSVEPEPTHAPEDQPTGTAIDSPTDPQTTQPPTTDPPQCDHSFGPWTYVSSCAKTRTCSKCGYTEGNSDECSTPAPTPAPAPTSPPTAVPACDHSFGPWTYVSSCAKTRTCSKCGYTEGNSDECSTPAPTPTPTPTPAPTPAPTSSPTAVPACVHSFGPWTYVSSCVKTRTCSKCGYTQSDSSGCN